MENLSESKWKVFLERYRYLTAEFQTEWRSHDLYGNWLPIEDVEEGEEAANWLIKWMYNYCYRFPLQEEHREEERLLEYFPFTADFIVKEKISEDPKDKNILAIRFKIGMRYIDEKPS